MTRTAELKEALRARLTGVENWSRLAWLAFRGILGWRFGAAVLLALGVGYYLSATALTDPGSAQVLLGRLFAVFALVLAAPMLPDERARGTLEIAWLSSGSLRRLLRWKMGVLVAGTGLASLPAVLVTSWFLQWRLNIPMTWLFILTQTALIGAWVFYVGSYLPHAWAGGLVAAAILLAIEWPASQWAGTFNPFQALYKNPLETIPWKAFIHNRLWVLALTWFFHDQTSRRSRQWMR